VPEFFGILPKFLTNQKFWECACIPCTPISYTTGNNSTHFPSFMFL